MDNASRRVFVILSRRAISYAEVCLRTLLAHAIEKIHLTLITDDELDRTAFEVLTSTIETGRHSIRIVTKSDCDQIAMERFSGQRGLLKFRQGHPCWRKITDPLLLSDHGDEIIVLDPDLYFPNQFTFEPTPSSGIALMRQGPNCLFPPAAVWRVLELGAPVANHVDIGIAQLRCATVDLHWLDWLVERIGTDEFTDFMHIEAIVWAALAMRCGGGHFDPAVWRCWERGYAKRLLVAAGLKGEWVLRLEPLHKLKCIHVSGPSKWWVVSAREKGILKPTHNRLDRNSSLIPYRELTRSRYSAERRLKDSLSSLGI